jgi:pilus assembly protein Flp/PilA
MKTFQALVRFVQNRSGATAIEYGLIAGLICIAIVGGATTLGQSANDSYTRVNEQVWGG